MARSPVDRLAESPTRLLGTLAHGPRTWDRPARAAGGDQRFDHTVAELRQLETLGLVVLRTGDGGAPDVGRLRTITAELTAAGRRLLAMDSRSARR